MSSTSDFTQRFSELINGESYTSVGEKIGLSKQTVSAYVSGIRSPKRPTIQAIANFYGVSPAWLIGLDAPKYEEKPAPVSESGLDEKTRELLTLVETLTPENQAKLIELARLYAEGQRRRKEDN